MKFIQAIDAAGGIVPLVSSGNPEGVTVGAIGQVCRNTANGELYLKGVGNNTNTGWKLITGGGGGGGGIGEAPIDGNSYYRKDGAWSLVPPTIEFFSEQVNWASAGPATLQNWYDIYCDGTTNTGASPSADFHLPGVPANADYHVWVDKDVWYYKQNMQGSPWTNMLSFAKGGFGAFITRIAGRSQ